MAYAQYYISQTLRLFTETFVGQVIIIMLFTLWLIKWVALIKRKVIG